MGQRETAHALLETYFRARIRCGGGKGGLEVVDVEDAVGSRERMVRGLEIEGGRRGSGVKEGKGGWKGFGKRKREVGVRDEGVDGERVGKVRRVERCVDGEPESLALSPLSAGWDREAAFPRARSPGTHLISDTRQVQQPRMSRQQSKLGKMGAKFSDRAFSLPNLTIPKTPLYSLPIPQSSRLPPRTPFTSLLNLSPTPTSSSTRLPPVSALIKETEMRSKWPPCERAEQDCLPALNEELMEQEMVVLKLELEEAHLALEVAKKEHAVAAKKAAISRLERDTMEKEIRELWNGPPQPGSLCKKIA